MVAASAATPAVAATPDAQMWTSAAVTGRLSKRVLVGADIVGRYVDDARRLGQRVIRAQIGTPLSKRVTVWIGYAHAATCAVNSAAAVEERSYEQLNWAVATLGTARLSSRTRLEQRYARGVDGTAWRLRDQVRFVVPLAAKGPSAVLWVEPIVSLNRTTAVMPGVDQVRGFAGVSVPLTGQIDVEAGYLQQYVVRRTGDRSNHTLSVSFAYRL